MKKYVIGLVLFLAILVAMFPMLSKAASLGDAKSVVSIINRNLGVGSKGEDVKTLQRILQEKGFLSATAKIDGSYGRLTSQAVIKYQKANNISTTGYFGVQTRKMLNSTISSVVESDKNIDIPCLTTSTPWIKVLSPNGGEVYNVGQSIPVTWQSCNIATTANIIPVFRYVDTNDSGEVHNSGAQSLAHVLNSGSTTIVPPTAMTPVYGKHYSITLVYQSYATGPNAVDVRDSSDNLFTINNIIPPAGQ